MDKKQTRDHEGSGPEDSSGSPLSSEMKKIKAPITPVRAKIGEARGNLQQRSDWFQRRSGGPQ